MHYFHDSTPHLRLNYVPNVFHIRIPWGRRYPKSVMQPIFQCFEVWTAVITRKACWIWACRHRASSSAGELERLGVLALANPATCKFPDVHNANSGPSHHKWTPWTMLRFARFAWLSPVSPGEQLWTLQILIPPVIFTMWELRICHQVPVCWNRGWMLGAGCWSLMILGVQ